MLVSHQYFIDDQVDGEEEEETSNTAGSNDEGAREDASEDVEQRNRAKEMITDATDSTERNASYRENLIRELNSGEHKELLKYLVAEMGGKVYTSHESNRKSAVKWLETPPVCSLEWVSIEGKCRRM